MKRTKKRITVTFFSGYDGREYTIPKPEHGSVTGWRSGKCWSAFCGNPIFYVHISKSGYATHGYCPHMREQELYKCWPRGKWYMLIKGKMKLVPKPKGLP